MPVGRAWRIGVVVLTTALGTRTPAGAQATADTADAPRALELTYRFAFNQAWGLGSPPGGAPSSIWADIPRTRGIGARLSYTIRPRIVLHLSTDLAVYGDLSGFSTVVLGGAYRTPLAPGLAVSAGAGVGHVVFSDEGFWNLVWGGDLRAALSRRLTLSVGVEVFEPLGEARGDGGARSAVTGAPSRLVLGLGWSFGRRVR